MNGRNSNFLENWIDGNITEIDKYSSQGRARELAAQCKPDAKVQGIALEDIAPEFGGLETIIYEIMHHGFEG